MSDIFLSYSREDARVAERVAKLLTDSGLDVWWDRRLFAGDDFNAEIEKALTEAGCVVVLWSAASVDSTWVRGEAQRAADLGKLVPIMIGPCRLPINFGQIHTPEVYRSREQLTDFARQLTTRLKPRVARAGSDVSAPQRPTTTDDKAAGEVAYAVVFSPTATHTFLEDLDALQRNPGRTVGERGANTLALWRKHPAKTSLYFVGVALLFGAMGALFTAYQFFYGACSASDAQMAALVQQMLVRAEQQLAVDGDVAAYRAKVREADQALRWTPHACRQPSTSATGVSSNR